MSIARKKKTCKSCGRQDFIFSKGNCKPCANIGYQKTYEDNRKIKIDNVLDGVKRVNKLLKANKLTDKYKVAKANERAAMSEYWEQQADIEGKCYCVECLLLKVHKSLACVGVQMNPYCVAHIISKGANKNFQADTRNFIILCPLHHHQFDAKAEGKTRRDMLIFEQTEEIRMMLKLEEHS